MSHKVLKIRWFGFIKNLDEILKPHTGFDVSGYLAIIQYQQRIESVYFEGNHYQQQTFSLSSCLSLPLFIWQAKITGSAKSDVLELYVCISAHPFTLQDQNRQKNRPTFKFCQERQPALLHAAHFTLKHTHNHRNKIFFRSSWFHWKLLSYRYRLDIYCFSIRYKMDLVVKQPKWIILSGWLVYSFISSETTHLSLLWETEAV